MAAVGAHGRREGQHTAGEGSGLVGAQQVHAAEVLDGVQAAHDHRGVRHPARPGRQGDRDDGRQHLWSHADREGDREEDGVDERAPEHHVDHEDDRGEPERHPGKKQAQARGALLEAGAHRPVGEGARHPPELGVRAREDRHGLTATAHDVAALQEGAVPLRERGVGGRGVGVLVARVGLAGQRGLVGLQGLGGEHPAVARHDVAGVQHHDVARHHLVGAHRHHPPGSPDLDVHLHPVEQPGDGHGGPVLLPEPQEAAEQHDGGDDERVDPVAEDEREPGGHEEDDHHRLGELSAQLTPDRPGTAGRSGAVALSQGAGAGLDVTETRWAAAHRVEHSLGLERPVGRRRLRARSRDEGTSTRRVPHRGRPPSMPTSVLPPGSADAGLRQNSRHGINHGTAPTSTVRHGLGGAARWLVS